MLPGWRQDFSVFQKPTVKLGLWPFILIVLGLLAIFVMPAGLVKLIIFPLSYCLLHPVVIQKYEVLTDPWPQCSTDVVPNEEGYGGGNFWFGLFRIFPYFKPDHMTTGAWDESSQTYHPERDISNEELSRQKRYDISAAVILTALLLAVVLDFREVGIMNFFFLSAYAMQFRKDKQAPEPSPSSEFLKEWEKGEDVQENEGPSPQETFEQGEADEEAVVQSKCSPETPRPETFVREETVNDESVEAATASFTLAKATNIISILGWLGAALGGACLFWGIKNESVVLTYTGFISIGLAGVVILQRMLFHAPSPGGMIVLSDEHLELPVCGPLEWEVVSKMEIGSASSLFSKKQATLKVYIAPGKTSAVERFLVKDSLSLPHIAQPLGAMKEPVEQLYGELSALSGVSITDLRRYESFS
jgi:hypothetical protein